MELRVDPNHGHFLQVVEKSRERRSSILLHGADVESFLGQFQGLDEEVPTEEGAFGNNLT